MRILWCAEHDAWIESDGDSCIRSTFNGPPCRLVPMRLIPDNAETQITEALRAVVLAALDGETP